MYSGDAHLHSCKMAKRELMEHACEDQDGSEPLARQQHIAEDDDGGQNSEELPGGRDNGAGQRTKLGHL